MSQPAWPKKGNHSPLRRSPLRHASNISNSSSEDNPNPSQPATLPRPSATSSPTPNGYRRTSAGQKRTIRDTSPTKSSADYHYDRSEKNSSAQPRSRRPSLQDLPQGANIMVPPAQVDSKQLHLRGGSQAPSSLSSYDGTRTPSPIDPRPKPQPSMALSRSDSRRAPTYDASARGRGSATDPQPQANVLDSSDFQKLGKSTTGHLRTLSKIAAADGDVEFKIASPEQAVVGLHGRRKLQRDMSQRGKKPMQSAGYGGRTWMDQQRQFLQAYEYLCHIGEAKEWIEDIIHKPIPPIVQLEEALRDGVTLAEVVQALKPERTLRIFQHPRLQFRHSDNIALFFKFLAEVELPELFRFELVDLYEKKNIPKVIYCIHALSWLLFRKGIVDFRIGNLVGQLEFEQHELETMQKGLDQAGINMPNFSGMSEKLGAGPEPEPEPVETEEDRIDRELSENQAAILDFQTQVRGAMLRIRLGDTMQSLWDSEDLLVDLQSLIRGDFARQISAYRTQMRRFAVDLQRLSRGFIVRSGEKRKETHWKAREKDVVILQSLARARAAKARTQFIKSKLQTQHHGIRDLQAAIRGVLGRWSVGDQWNETRVLEPTVVKFQSRIRGAIRRRQNQEHENAVKHAEPTILQLQTLIRASKARSQHQDLARQVQMLNGSWTELQSLARSFVVRSSLAKTHAELALHRKQKTKLQALLRGRKQRLDLTSQTAALSQHSDTVQRLQSAIRGSKIRQRFHADKENLRKVARQISSLQAQCRGCLQRSNVENLLCELDGHEPAITGLQSVLKAIMVRNDFADMLEAIENEEEAIVQLQAAARASMVRSAFAEKQRYFNENMKKVIKIQSFVRGRQQGQAYKSLTSGQNPPVGTVKNFVHLLNDSDFDFEEELQSEVLQKELVQRKQKNEQTEQWIADLDAKIGLLAHTKIASDELAKMRKHNMGNLGGTMARHTSVRDSFNLKGLSKSSRAKLDRYQELFFILQTQPQYFARLFRRAREKGLTDQDQRKLESLTLSAFAHAQKRREEYFLLKLVARSAKEEIDSSASLQDYMRGTFFFSRLFNGYTTKAAGSKDRQYVRKLFGNVISSWFIDNEHLDLESDPLQIHRAVINDEELRTGKRSNQNLDVPREEAIKDPRIRSIFISHLQDMRSIVEDFFSSMEEAVARMPYGTRYIASQMFTALRTKFPKEDEAILLQIVGNWLWRNYLKPAVADPEGYGVVGRGFEPKQRRNLADFLKVISQIATGRPFGEDNIYLQPLNTTVVETIDRYAQFLLQVVNVPEAEQRFDISEFNDLYAKVKPTLYIRMADVFAIHRMIADDISSLCISHDDNVLRTIINDLGDARTNESEIGGSGGDVNLSLGTKFHAQHDPNADIKALFMETKRCVLFIIRIQAGNNLMDIMVKPITADDESRWESLVREEIAVNNSSRKRTAYTDGPSTNLVDIASMSYTELKRIALENILSLEKAGRLTRHNQYQDLLNEIAVDIRNKHRRRVQRQRELENVRTTIAHLDEKQGWLDDRLKVYNDTFEQNLGVLQGKSAKGVGRAKFVMPFSKQWHHNRDLERLGREPRYGSYKRAAEHFQQKGILISWEGRDLRNDDLTISSNEINTFTIEGSSGSINITGASAVFSWDDLLDAEYEGRTTLEFFNEGGVQPVEEGRRRKPKKGVLLVDRAAFKAWMSKKFFPDA